MHSLTTAALIFLVASVRFCTAPQLNTKAHKPRFAHDIDDFEVVVPKKVTYDGKFVSHSLPHEYKRSYYNRKKIMDLDDGVHYQVPINGEVHHVELWPNHEMVSSGMVIETRKGGEDVAFRKGTDASCHYQGRIRGHGKRRSAVSTCEGLTGILRTKRGSYMIEPSWNHEHGFDGQHPHIIYQVGNEDEPNCGTSGDALHALAKRAVRERRVRASPVSGTVDGNFANKSKPAGGENASVETKSKSGGAKSNGRLHLETLLVLDKTLIEFHGNTDVENYALTVVNMAYNLYHDASMETRVCLTVVRIVRLEDDEKEMNVKINSNAKTTLDHFCAWQQKMNPGDDKHPNHHDVALLVTRVDICADETNCGLLGLARMAGACDPPAACALAQDTGLKLGYVIAHELAHTLGVDHDVKVGNDGCEGHLPNGFTTVMNPAISMKTEEWTKCSSEDVRAFLLSGFGQCLKDEPADHAFNMQDMLPGVMYGGDYQCRALISEQATECEMGLTCDSLNCEVPGYGCMETHVMPAPGTSCGEKKWCYQRRCLELGERPGAVDGGWGAWGDWGPCSRSCGSGVAVAERECNSPMPSHNGKFCVGDQKRHRICATQPCDTSSPSFRDEQCAEFNDWVYPEDGKTHKWTGHYMHDENPCSLFCKNEKDTVAMLKPKVVDGTSCTRGIRDICIGGACREVPCDMSLESHSVEDVCGICHGDGTECTIQDGTKAFEEDAMGLKKLVDVPLGARNIHVDEQEPTHALIVVFENDKTDPLIKGDKLGMFEVPGSSAWLGMARMRQESLHIPGPITKPISIFVRPIEPVKLSYSIAVSRAKKRCVGGCYSWDFIAWSPCSAQCGPGDEVAVARCVERQGGLVEDCYCKHFEKPDEKNRPCFLQPCLTRWMVGDWQKDCKDCAPGDQTCVRTRSVVCMKPTGEDEGESDLVADNLCAGVKPHDTEPCFKAAEAPLVAARALSSVAANEAPTNLIAILREMKEDPVNDFLFNPEVVRSVVHANQTSYDAGKKSNNLKVGNKVIPLTKGKREKENKDRRLNGRVTEKNETEVDDDFDGDEDEDEGDDGIGDRDEEDENEDEIPASPKKPKKICGTKERKLRRRVKEEGVRTKMNLIQEREAKQIEKEDTGGKLNGGCEEETETEVDVDDNLDKDEDKEDAEVGDGDEEDDRQDEEPLLPEKPKTSFNTKGSKLQRKLRREYGGTNMNPTRVIEKEEEKREDKREKENKNGKLNGSATEKIETEVDADETSDGDDDEGDDGVGDGDEDDDLQNEEPLLPGKPSVAEKNETVVDADENFDGNDDEEDDGERDDGVGDGDEEDDRQDEEHVLLESPSETEKIETEVDADESSEGDDDGGDDGGGDGDEEDDKQDVEPLLPGKIKITLGKPKTTCDTKEGKPKRRAKREYCGPNNLPVRTSDKKKREKGNKDKGKASHDAEKTETEIDSDDNAEGDGDDGDEEIGGGNDEDDIQDEERVLPKQSKTICDTKDSKPKTRVKRQSGVTTTKPLKAKMNRGQTVVDVMDVKDFQITFLPGKEGNPRNTSMPECLSGVQALQFINELQANARKEKEKQLRDEHTKGAKRYATETSVDAGADAAQKQRQEVKMEEDRLEQKIADESRLGKTFYKRAAQDDHKVSLLDIEMDSERDDDLKKIEEFDGTALDRREDMLDIGRYLTSVPLEDSSLEEHGSEIGNQAIIASVLEDTEKHNHDNSESEGHEKKEKDSTQEEINDSTVNEEEVPLDMAARSDSVDAQFAQMALPARKSGQADFSLHGGPVSKLLSSWQRGGADAKMAADVAGQMHSIRDSAVQSSQELQPRGGRITLFPNTPLVQTLNRSPQNLFQSDLGTSDSFHEPVIIPDKVNDHLNDVSLPKAEVLSSIKQLNLRVPGRPWEKLPYAKEQDLDNTKQMKKGIRPLALRPELYTKKAPTDSKVLTLAGKTQGNDPMLDQGAFGMQPSLLKPGDSYYKPTKYPQLQDQNQEYFTQEKNYKQVEKPRDIDKNKLQHALDRKDYNQVHQMLDQDIKKVQFAMNKHDNQQAESPHKFFQNTLGHKNNLKDLQYTQDQEYSGGYQSPNPEKNHRLQAPTQLLPSPNTAKVLYTQDQYYEKPIQPPQQGTPLLKSPINADYFNVAMTSFQPAETKSRAQNSAKLTEWSSPSGDLDMENGIEMQHAQAKNLVDEVYSDLNPISQKQNYLQPADVGDSPAKQEWTNLAKDVGSLRSSSDVQQQDVYKFPLSQQGMEAKEEKPSMMSWQMSAENQNKAKLPAPKSFMQPTRRSKYPLIDAFRKDKTAFISPSSNFKDLQYQNNQDQSIAAEQAPVARSPFQDQRSFENTLDFEPLIRGQPHGRYAKNNFVKESIDQQFDPEDQFQSSGEQDFGRDLNYDSFNPEANEVMQLEENLNGRQDSMEQIFKPEANPDFSQELRHHLFKPEAKHYFKEPLMDQPTEPVFNRHFRQNLMQKGLKSKENDGFRDELFSDPLKSDKIQKFRQNVYPSLNLNSKDKPKQVNDQQLKPEAKEEPVHDFTYHSLKLANPRQELIDQLLNPEPMQQFMQDDTNHPLKFGGSRHELMTQPLKSDAKQNHSLQLGNPRQELIDQLLQPELNQEPVQGLEKHTLNPASPRQELMAKTSKSDAKQEFLNDLTYHPLKSGNARQEIIDQLFKPEPKQESVKGLTNHTINSGEPRQELTAQLLKPDKKHEFLQDLMNLTSKPGDPSQKLTAKALKPEERLNQNLKNHSLKANVTSKEMIAQELQPEAKLKQDMKNQLLKLDDKQEFKDRMDKPLKEDFENELRQELLGQPSKPGLEHDLKMDMMLPPEQLSTSADFSESSDKSIKRLQEHMSRLNKQNRAKEEISNQPLREGVLYFGDLPQRELDIIEAMGAIHREQSRDCSAHNEDPNIDELLPDDKIGTARLSVPDHDRHGEYKFDALTDDDDNDHDDKDSIASDSFVDKRNSGVYLNQHSFGIDQSDLKTDEFDYLMKDAGRRLEDEPGPSRYVNIIPEIDSETLHDYPDVEASELGPQEKDDEREMEDSRRFVESLLSEEDKPMKPSAEMEVGSEQDTALRDKARGWKRKRRKKRNVRRCEDRPHKVHAHVRRGETVSDAEEVADTKLTFIRDKEEDLRDGKPVKFTQVEGKEALKIMDEMQKQARKVPAADPASKVKSNSNLTQR